MHIVRELALHLFTRPDSYYLLSKCQSASFGAIYLYSWLQVQGCREYNVSSYRRYAGFELGSEIQLTNNLRRSWRFHCFGTESA